MMILSIIGGSAGEMDVENDDDNDDTDIIMLTL